MLDPINPPTYPNQTSRTATRGRPGLTVRTRPGSAKQARPLTTPSLNAVAALEDEYGITMGDDSASDEERFVTLGMDSKARVVVVVYAYRGENIRIISARVAEHHERAEYEA